MYIYIGMPRLSHFSRGSTCYFAFVLPKGEAFSFNLTVGRRRFLFTFFLWVYCRTFFILFSLIRYICAHLVE